MDNQEKILDEVRQERQRQYEKWGQQNHQPPFWLMILGEEVGEANRAALEKDVDNYRKELIQIAAVAVSMVECLDRNTQKSSE